MKHAALKQLVARFIKDFETDPTVQFEFHRIAMYFWILNAIFVIVAMFLFPDFWLKIGLVYIAIVSLYANWDTDYDAMSASGSWIESKNINKKVS